MSTKQQHKPTRRQARARHATLKQRLAHLARDLLIALALAFAAAPVPELLRAAPPLRACEAQVHALVVAPFARPRCLVARAVLQA
jgi:hypothetical protein